MTVSDAVLLAVDVVLFAIMGVVIVVILKPDWFR